MNKIYTTSGQREPTFFDLENYGSEIVSDWNHRPVTPAARWLFWITETRFYFLASREKTALSHPNAAPHEFHAELWRYDVAEFFLKSAKSSSYLEFNLAPSGAWWSCRFQAPRIPAMDEPRALPGVETKSEILPEGWRVSASIPLDTLGSLERAALNTTFILESPEQIFLSAAGATPGEPDFHQPDEFPLLTLHEIEEK